MVRGATRPIDGIKRLIATVAEKLSPTTSLPTGDDPPAVIPARRIHNSTHSVIPPETEQVCIHAPGPDGYRLVEYLAADGTTLGGRTVAPHRVAGSFNPEDRTYSVAVST